MTTMTDEMMQQIDGEFRWGAFSCGFFLALGVGGALMTGPAAIYVLAAGITFAPSACGLALVEALT